jgi:hypothetical protein
LLFVAALALFCLGVIRASAAPRAVSAADYWQKLSDTHALAVRLEGQPAAAARTQLAAAADEWAGITSVTLADGSVLPIDNAYLLALLRADPAQPAAVAAATQAMAAVGTAWPPPRHAARDLQPLATILTQPEFQWTPAEPNWLETLRDRFLSWLARLLSRLLSGTGLATGGDLLGSALAWLAALAVIAVLVYMLRGLFLNFAPEISLPDETGRGDEGLTAEAAGQRAQTLSAGGDYRSAVRYLYLSALLHLEEASLLRYDRSLTNREYLRSLSGRPELAERLQGVVEVFDRVWYGFDSLDSAAYADYAARVTALLAAALREQK